MTIPEWSEGSLTSSRRARAGVEPQTIHALLPKIPSGPARAKPTSQPCTRDNAIRLILRSNPPRAGGRADTPSLRPGSWSRLGADLQYFGAHEGAAETPRAGRARRLKSQRASQNTQCSIGCGQITRLTLELSRKPVKIILSRRTTETHDHNRSFQT